MSIRSIIFEYAMYTIYLVLQVQQRKRFIIVISEGKLKSKWLSYNYSFNIILWPIRMLQVLSK